MNTSLASLANVRSVMPSARTSSSLNEPLLEFIEIIVKFQDLAFGLESVLLYLMLIRTFTGKPFDSDLVFFTKGTLNHPSRTILFLESRAR